MKKLVLLAVAFLSISVTNAKDVIFMKNGNKVKGRVISITNEQLTLISKNSTQVFTADQVAYIKSDQNNDVLNKALEAYGSASDDYSKGQIDAQTYHKRAFGNAALGFFFGPFGFLGVAIGGAKTPDVMDIKDESLLKNEDYRAGYKKKAKAKNLGNAGIGCGAWVGLVLLASASIAQ